ncbi:MAG: ThiF family adenylyltransferase, partial [Deltaproteobacteria bacterium]|nr:ThiF family adenylyltransferase [Deltaproteobacteria bacterium]
MSAITRIDSQSGEQPFDYDRAFSRNIGLVSRGEQARLRGATVALAGLGGVGGIHLMTLARAGIGSFRLADFDAFELHNFNRQAGATLSSVDRPKLDVMAEIAYDINPELRIERFEQGVTEENVEAFVRGADMVVDGIDFFAVDARALLHRTAERFGVPVVAAGPLGFSTAYLLFVPGGMRWDDYFAMDLAKNDFERFLLFALGNAPAGTQTPYWDPRELRLDEKRGPSFGLAAQLCAGVVCAEVLKQVLGRGDVYAAPYYHQFDAYRCVYIRRKLRGGNRAWSQRLRFLLLRELYQEDDLREAFSDALAPESQGLGRKVALAKV